MLRRALLNAQRLVKSSAIANRTSTIIRPQYGWVSRFSSTNISNAQSLEMDLSTEESKRRLFNRLLYRSKQRGFLELDLVLGKWVEEHIYSMDENGIKALVHVLDLVFSVLENVNCWLATITHKPNLHALSSCLWWMIYVFMVFSAVQEKVRATPGQPCVRGWDDFRKGHDVPITGGEKLLWRNLNSILE
ncbi:hypothetical protein Gogos_014202 [Gossypium gossypioides]|uniref:Succinate dehydrogenase assembly factor 2, mitochondrial n=1 Tax=Gossypium gossypioides TaxID=34282 RepID=A0A7J9BXZ9_GOSGO|nr:hypothetical protein [Gossypium gossypioides]